MEIRISRFFRGKKVGTVLLAALMLIAALSVMVSVATTEAAAAGTTPSWTSETSLPTAIAQAAVVNGDDGNIYVFGGASEETFEPLSASYKFDPKTNTWTSLAPMWTAARGAAVAVGPYGLIFVFGGAGPSGMLDSIQVYDPSFDNWSLASSSLAVPVWEGKACYHEPTGQFYIVGGENSMGMPLKTVQYYEPRNDVAGVMAAGYELPDERAAGDLVLDPTEGKLWYFGGEDASYGWTNTILELDPSTPGWSERYVMNGLFCAQEVVRGVDGLYYVLGGGEGVYNIGEGYEYCYVFDPNGGRWFGIPDLPEKAKYLGAGASLDGRIFAIGGANNGTVSSSVYSLKVVTYEVTVSDTVKAGESVTVTISVDAPFAVIDVFSVGAYVKGPDNVTFGYDHINTFTADSFQFDIPVPQGAASGDYEVIIPWLYIEYANWDRALQPEKSIAFTVVAQDSASDQISELEDKLSGKADSLLVYLNIVLLVVVVVLLAFMMLRRRT